MHIHSQGIDWRVTGDHELRTLQSVFYTLLGVCLQPLDQP